MGSLRVLPGCIIIFSKLYSKEEDYEVLTTSGQNMLISNEEEKPVSDINYEALRLIDDLLDAQCPL